MEKALLIGRWQVPKLHDGHLALMQEVIDMGYRPVIAIRATEIDLDNLYSVSERYDMIVNQLGDLVDVIIIPDISVVVHGRDVGYKVVRLAKDIESISGTEIRKSINDCVDNG